MLAKELKEDTTNSLKSNQISLKDGSITVKKELIELEGINRFSICRDITNFVTQNGNVDFVPLNPEDPIDQTIKKSYPRPRNTDELLKVEKRQSASSYSISINIGTDYQCAYLKYFIWKDNEWQDVVINLKINDVNSIELPKYIGYFNILATKSEEDTDGTLVKLYSQCPVVPNKMIIKDGYVLVDKLAEGNEDGHKIKIVQKASRLATTRGRRRN